MADPLEAVAAALAARQDLLGWTARRRHVRGEQLFADRHHIESRRSVEIDEVTLDVLAPSGGAQGDGSCGAARATVASGEDPRAAIEFAVAAARGTRSPRYELPRVAPLPDVPLADPELGADLPRAIAGLHERLLASASEEAGARLTQAEWFAEDETTHLVNSNGIDALQQRTEVSLEWIVLAGDGDARAETIFDLTRRRLADVHVEEEWRAVARQTIDRQRAEPAPPYEGPVVLRGHALATFLNSDTIQTLGSARARFAKLSHWEIGTPVIPGGGTGEPLTLYATRLLPYGTHASRIDGEGLPGQKICLIRGNQLEAFSASQRYASYLGVPATGAFGDLEIPAGVTPATDLLAGPHIEISSWSWFNPESTTGNFASEIRLGYRVDAGERRPFSGGLLVGNLLQGLADTTWSAETGFYGDYRGPTTARISSLKVTPSRGS